MAAAATAGDGVDRSGRDAAARRWEELKRQYAPDLAKPEPVVEAVRPPAKPLKVLPISDPVEWRASAMPLQASEDDLLLEPLEDDGPDVDEDAEPDPPTVRERVAEETRLRPLSSIVPRFDYAPEGTDRCLYLCPRPADCPDGKEAATRCPVPETLPVEGSSVRVFAPTQYAWAASNLVYNPLYFEDASLERSGQLYPEWAQPFASMGLFSVQLAGLPYQMAIDPACSCVSPLGFHRPGEAAPCVKKALPWNPRAAAEAAAVYTGLIFLVP